MKNILIHGLGQTSKSWNQTKKILNENDMIVETPDLFRIDELTYQNLYQSISEYCNSQNEKLNLCGLSLGGILALSFAKQYPDKVNSMILIGTPYKIPKILFHIQNLIFHMMPTKTFIKLGLSKKQFITLIYSMKNLDIAQHLEKITCPTLILCGKKDKVNLKSAELLNQNITNSKFEVIENSSHEVNIDAPIELASKICDFWKKS